jgi:ABC-type branched-subunit amino acid transport system ATPase component
MTAALELQGVSSGYGEALVLRELDLTVQPGEIFALLGKNGMGKSTLLKTIMGYLRVRSGRILVAGDETTGSAPHRVARINRDRAANTRTQTYEQRRCDEQLAHYTTPPCDKGCAAGLSGGPAFIRRPYAPVPSRGGNRKGNY